MKLPETILLQTNQAQTISQKEGMNMKAEKNYKPFHFSTELERQQTVSPTNATCERTLLIHELPTKRDELIMNDLNRKKADLERKSLNLEREILEKQQTLMILQQAIQTATSEVQSASVSQLAAGLAHEIRNPLTTIKGFIQLLQREIQEVGKKDFADVALDEINRANRMLTEFLSVLKPCIPEKKKVTMNKIAESILKLFSSESMLKDIEIRSTLPDEELYVLADENGIKQVLVNLLKNAMEAVEGSHASKAEITLTVSKLEGFVIVSVTDNGGGIDEFTLEKIFAPFYTTKTNGTGIGLAISKEIIENHGGKMSVATDNNKTTFKFALPAV
jgi:signal transduction histidine kinase